MWTITSDEGMGIIFCSVKKVMPRRIKLDNGALNTIELMVNLGCTMQAIAQMLSDLGYPLSIRSLYYLKRNDEKVRRAFAVGAAKSNLRVAQRILDLALDGHFQALKYWEATRCGITEPSRFEVKHSTKPPAIIIQKQSA